MGGDIALPRTCGSAGISTPVRAVHDVDHRKDGDHRKQAHNQGTPHDEQYTDISAMWRAADSPVRCARSGQRLGTPVLRGRLPAQAAGAATVAAVRAVPLGEALTALALGNSLAEFRMNVSSEIT